MHFIPTDLDLEMLHTEAESAAARLVRRLGLSRPDREDVRQELLADLIRRLSAFDPSRGTLGAFAGTVLKHRASRIAARITRERKLWNGGLLSLDTSGPDGECLADKLADDVGLPGWQRGNLSAISATEERLGLGRATSTLTDAERTLCAAATHASVQDLVERGFASRATVYRQLRNVHCVLIAGGVGAL